MAFSHDSEGVLGLLSFFYFYFVFLGTRIWKHFNYFLFIESGVSDAIWVQWGKGPFSRLRKGHFEGSLGWYQLLLLAFFLESSINVFFFLDGWTPKASQASFSFCNPPLTEVSQIFSYRLVKSLHMLSCKSFTHNTHTLCYSWYYCTFTMWLGYHKEYMW